VAPSPGSLEEYAVHFDDLHRHPPAHRLYLPLHPGVDPLSVEGSAVGPLVEGEQAVWRRVVDLRLTGSQLRTARSSRGSAPGPGSPWLRTRGAPPPSALALQPVFRPVQVLALRGGLSLHATLPLFFAQAVSTSAASKPSSSSWERAQRTISRTSSAGSPMKASWIAPRSQNSTAAAWVQKASSATMALVEGVHRDELLHRTLVGPLELLGPALRLGERPLALVREVHFLSGR
jgi:hypothetical protein